MPAHERFASFEAVYGAQNLADQEDWLMADGTAPDTVGVRIITAAPEIDGVMATVPEVVQRGVVFSIGHRCVRTALTSTFVHAADIASRPPISRRRPPTTARV